MVNFKSLIFILIPLQCLLACNKESSTPNRSLNVEPILTLGTDTLKSSKMFSMATEAIKYEGKLFVVDAGESAVRVYNKRGKFLKYIGKEGAGPDEFKSISDLYIDRKNRIVVTDESQGRILFFTLKGKFITTSRLPPIGNVEQVTEVSNSFTFVGAHKNNLVHVADNTISNIETSFVDIDEVLVSDRERLEEIWIQYSPGNILPISEDSILYSPDIYSGKIFLYGKGDEKDWSRLETFKGYSRYASNPVTFSPFEQADRVDAPIVFSEDRYAAQFHSKSKGLFFQNPDTLIHFSAQERKTNSTKIDLIAERFNLKGELLDYSVVDSMERNNLDVLWMRNNSFLMSDTKDIPQVKLVKVSHD